MQKKITQFEIPYLQFLDGEGNVNASTASTSTASTAITSIANVSSTANVNVSQTELPAFLQNVEQLIDMYSLMVRTRIFDAKAVALQRTGKIGTYPSTLGQEAIGAAIGIAMKPEDVLCPYYRETPAQFYRGVKMSEILLYWGGDERGSCFTNPKVREDFPICVPIASQTLHAVGVGLAFKLRHQPRVALTVVGDGGTSRGDFYEALNLAGVMNLPVVFVINNNQWAISVPRKQQSAAETLAQKGLAGGVVSEQVDGNDIFALRFAVEKALGNARSGKGPTVIEALTYRMGDHTTADDARRYRDQAELERHGETDPILRFSKYLVKQNLWNEAKEQALQKAAAAEVVMAVEEFLNTKPMKPESMFDHLYETLPHSYFTEREEMLKMLSASANAKANNASQAEQNHAKRGENHG